MKGISELSELIIMGEGDYRINFIKEKLFSVSPYELTDLILRVDDHYFKTLVYYFQLFRSLDEMTELYNNPDFGMNAMEKIVLYLNSHMLINDYSIENLFPIYFPGLNQERYFSLLAGSRHVSRDHAICMNIIANLNKKYLDLYFIKKENLERLILFLKVFSPERQVSFFMQNTDLYHYLKAFLDAGTVVDDVIQKVVMDCEKQVEEARRLILFSSRLNDVEKMNIKVNPRRIKAIIGTLRDSPEVTESINLMVKRNIFQDTTEKEIVTNIMNNPQFAYILDEIPDFTQEELKYFKGSELVFF